MEVALAVLPVGHRRPRLERLVRRGLLVHVALDDQIRFLEPFLDVAERERFSGFRVLRELALIDQCHLGRGPLQVRMLGPTKTLPCSRPLANRDAAPRADRSCGNGSKSTTMRSIASMRALRCRQQSRGSARLRKQVPRQREFRGHRRRGGAAAGGVVGAVGVPAGGGATRHGAGRAEAFGGGGLSVLSAFFAGGAPSALPAARPRRVVPVAAVARADRRRSECHARRASRARRRHRC